MKRYLLWLIYVNNDKAMHWFDSEKELLKFVREHRDEWMNSEPKVSELLVATVEGNTELSEQARLLLVSGKA